MVRKKKERKRAAVVRHPLPFCFFSLPLLRKKARNSVFTRVGEEGERRRRKIVPATIVIFCEGSRTMRFFYVFSVVRIARNRGFWEIGEGWRGERRGPWVRSLKVL